MVIESLLRPGEQEDLMLFSCRYIFKINRFGHKVCVVGDSYAQKSLLSVPHFRPYFFGMLQDQEYERMMRGDRELRGNRKVPDGGRGWRKLKRGKYGKKKKNHKRL